MHGAGVLLLRVSPFGNPRIEAYVRLPVAYRSLSRPSSAPDAKAFPLRSFQLDLAVSRIMQALISGSFYEIVIVTLLNSLSRVLKVSTIIKASLFASLLPCNFLFVQFSRCNLRDK